MSNSKPSLALLHSLCLVAGLAALAGVASASDGPRLLLAGGATPVCSNLGAQYCKDPESLGPAPLSRRFRLDAEGLTRLRSSGWLAHRLAARERIHAALLGWFGRAGVIDFSVADLSAALGGSKADTRAWAELAGFEQARVLDALERSPVAERVALSASTDASSAAIFHEFVAMARVAGGRQRPRILVSTASSRDPFAAIDFYLQLFEQAGAQVRWLPLDHAWRAAQRSPKVACDRLDRSRGQLLAAHDRDRLYPKQAQQLASTCRQPQQVREALEWADGLFLNGGDQSFTRAAWFDGPEPSQELKLLLERLDAGELVLGGTSAGTAVQAARSSELARAMLVSGPALPSTEALALESLPPDASCKAAKACGDIDPDALLYHPDGGLGSFALGVLDTHFSNRGREYRLARLLLDSGVSLGVGVDEGTALRLDKVGEHWRGTIVGHGGVTLMQRIDSRRVHLRRFEAGAALVLPLATAPAIECQASDRAAVEVTAGDDGLRAFIAKLDTRRTPLIVRGEQRRQSAGHLCASEDRSFQQWEFSAKEG